LIRGRFQIVTYEEGGQVRSQESPNLRLVCITDSNEKLVIWGEEDKNRTNIDKVLQAGLPCQIDCEYREPTDDFRKKFGHTYWVPQDAKLELM